MKRFLPRKFVMSEGPREDLGELDGVPTDSMGLGGVLGGGGTSLMVTFNGSESAPCELNGANLGLVCERFSFF